MALSSSSAGWASQWYYSPFTATVTIDGEEITAELPTAEHWMMLQKALLFKDSAVAREVLDADASDMAYVKALGRKVQNFDNDTWNAARERIVLEGNLLKFGQNEELKAKLLATGSKLLVEASPRDRIWGVGFGEKNALSQKDRWGLNLLGKALEEARSRLRDDETEDHS